MVETEDSFTYTEFRDAFSKKWNLWRKRKLGTPVIIGTYSDGTRFFWEDELGDRHYGLVSDLSSFSISRVGQKSLTFGLGLSGVIGTDAISPVLNDVIANWRVFANVEAGSSQITGTGTLLSTSSIRLAAWRPPSGVSITAVDFTTLTDDLTVSQEPDVGHNHALSTLIDNPVGVMSFPATAPTVKVDWMIVHK